MRSLFGILVAVTTFSSSHAFVAPRPFLRTHHKTKNTALRMMDPLQLWESVSSSLTVSDAAVPEAAGVSYSKASYYTVLALYLMSFPGLWSQIKRSTTAKVKRKTYVR